MAKFYVTVTAETVSSTILGELNKIFGSSVKSGPLEKAVVDGAKAGLAGNSDFSATAKAAKQIGVIATVKSLTVDNKTKPTKLNAEVTLKCTLLGATLQSATVTGKAGIDGINPKQIEGDAVATLAGAASGGIKKQLIPHATKNW